LEDPLEVVLREQHAQLVKEYGHQSAAQLLLRLLEYANEPDRQTAVLVILKSGA